MRTWKHVVVKSATQSSAEDFSGWMYYQTDERASSSLFSEGQIIVCPSAKHFLICEMGWLWTNSAAGHIE